MKKPTKGWFPLSLDIEERKPSSPLLKLIDLCAELRDQRRFAVAPRRRRLSTYGTVCPGCTAMSVLEEHVFRDEDRVTHLASAAMVRLLDLSPQAQSAKLELWQLLLISRRRQAFSVSRARFRPPGNIHRPSHRRFTKRTLPRLAATSLDALAILAGNLRL